MNDEEKPSEKLEKELRKAFYIPVHVYFPNFSDMVKAFYAHLGIEVRLTTVLEFVGPKVACDNGAPCVIGGDHSPRELLELVSGLDHGNCEK